MGWQSPINGGQGSWTGKIVVALLAFAVLLGIGYYNGRQSHPEIFDTEHVAQPGTSTSLRPNSAYSYPQIDMTEKLAKEAAEAKKKAAEAAKKAKKNGKGAKNGQGDQAQANAAKNGQGDQSQANAAKNGKGDQAQANDAKNGKGDQAQANDAKNGKGDQAQATPPALESAQAVPDMVYDTSWPPPNNRPRTESTFMRRIPSMLFFLALVCALIWVILRIAAPFSGKLTGNAPKKKQITLVERFSLGPNKGVALVEVSGKRLVLGITDKAITTLAELEAPPPEADPPVPQDKDTPAPPSPPKDLVKEVIAKHLEALPSLTK